MEDYRLWIVIGAAFIFCLMRLTAKSVFIRWAGKAGICSELILLLNIIIPQYAVALNGYTFGIAAILGLPGVMMMYVIKMII